MVEVLNTELKTQFKINITLIQLNQRDGRILCVNRALRVSLECLSEKMAVSSMRCKVESKMERFISPGKGNGLRALSEIKPGQLIYSSEPIAFCVAEKFLKSTCQTCLCR